MQKRLLDLCVLPNGHSTKAYLLEKLVSAISLVILRLIWVFMILHYVNVLPIGLSKVKELHNLWFDENCLS